MLRALPAAFAVALLLPACAADRTAILVEVTSPDLNVPGDIDGLRFQAVSEYGARVDREFTIQETWPHSLTIVPPESERMGSMTITVTGTRGGELVVRRVVSTSFQRDTTRRIVVTFTADCRGVVCQEGIDCAAGMCVGGGGADAGVDDAGVDDAGAPEDAGGDDAGSTGDDAGTIDAGAMDAGIDAGTTDAGADAGATDAGAGPSSPLVINEIDYDQASTDSAEFVEILNTGTSAVDLTGLSVVLLNGSSTPAAQYGRVELSGALDAGQFLVVATAGVTGIPTSARSVALTPATNAIQNGPDAVALWDMANVRIVDALAYGSGVTTGTIDGQTVSLVSGAAATVTDSTSAVRSLCRSPDGSDTGDDATDWLTCATPTPGAPNVR